jgi:glycosyltransferase involved in cell wall biosynthesis
MPQLLKDFGMVPVEVMSHGISVIAFADGGSKETIVDQKTGLFFKKYDPVTLNQTIEKFEQMQFNATDCINQAKKFAPWIFEKSFLAQVNSLLLES